MNKKNTEEQKEYKERYSVSLTPTMWEMIGMRAEEVGVNRSAWINMLLKRELQKLEKKKAG